MSWFIVFCAQYLVVLVALGGAATVALSPRRARLMLVLALALPLGYALARLAGLFFSHTQPFDTLGFEPLIPHEVNNSFPSDHAVLAGVFAGVACLAHRAAGALLFALALLVGAARAAAGLHWPGDIAAGLAIAALAVFGAHTAVRAYSSVRHG